MRFHPGFWRKCRIGFRWFRIATLLAVLALVCTSVWFNRVGLPDFLKRPLVETLRARGVELEFTRLRLRFVRGIVADNVRIGHAATPDSPKLTLAEVQLRLDHRALWHRQLQISDLILRDGKLVWPLTSSNSLTLDHIQTDLRFQTNDTWSLDHFQAGFAGVKLTLVAEIAHAPELRHWELFRGGKTGGWTRESWQKFSDTLNRIHFEDTPRLKLAVNGDALDLHSFDVQLGFSVPAVQTPWGSASNLQLHADLTAPPDTPATPDPSWAWWTNLQPYRLVWTVQLTRLRSEKSKADSAICAGFWQAPWLAITNLSARLGGGQLEAQAQLNVATRQFAFTNTSNFDVHAITALLREKTRERLAQFHWTQPPWLRVGGSLTLPAWTNRQPDWQIEIQPTVRLAGEIVLTNSTAFGIKFDSARTHFGYSYLTWQLPDLALVQAGTRLALAGEENDATKNYRWHIRGSFDPESLRPFLTTSNAQRGLGIFKFNAPAELDLEARGHLYDYNSMAAAGRMALTNFAVRNQEMDSVVSGFQYSNRVVEFFSPRLRRAEGTQQLTADTIRLDLNSQLIWFVNGYGVADPQAIANAIGPKTGRDLEPYHFLEPPTVRVNGCAPLQGRDGADLKFDVVKGTPFQWLRFKTPHLAGTIHWWGQLLILTNVSAAFYGGNGWGSASFDFRAPHVGADYQFTLNFSGVNLHLLATQLFSPTNHLEGTLDGQLAVTQADTRDWHTWNGFGHASLHDGLLWDIPAFGILSPVLNSFSPGLGNSRATEATARFIITNGVIVSDSLVIRSTMMRLQYTGTVDMKENLNARVTAQLLRDTWLVGPLVSTALWPVSKLFEYHITGTLNNPKSEPVFVPRFLLMPFHPIRSLEELFPGNNSLTNSSPEK